MTEKSFSTLRPQHTDSPYDLVARGTKAKAQVQDRLVKGASSLSGAAGATAVGQVMAANPARQKWGIQNAGTNVLTVRLGDAAIDLRAATANDAGNGARVEDEDWKGAVSVEGTSPRYNWSEQ
jgi:hypothetical protein